MKSMVSQRRAFLSTAVSSLASLAIGLVLSSCAAPPKPIQVPLDTPPTLSAGDVIKVSFPGTPNLDTQQQIRRDGRLNLALVGEVMAEGKTPAGLEKELTDLYSPQLVSKEVKVTIVSSSFAVFVTGAVLKPGKILPDRTVSVLEAVMEAGGFDYTKANTKKVVIIRQENGQTKNYTVNLKAVLDGKGSEPFYLKSHDIVYVPEKFNWF
jgi:polysaccharide biosynthesis/export protein